jgi:hypothetical protein
MCTPWKKQGLPRVRWHPAIECGHHPSAATPGESDVFWSHLEANGQ